MYGALNMTKYPSEIGKMPVSHCIEAFIWRYRNKEEEKVKEGNRNDTHKNLAQTHE